ncbi:MAG: recombinase RecT [Burkholderiales bacterium]|nr:recombinase RecT [Burkholderiales bacterium]
MKRIYISGPMTGLPELNFPAFNAEAARLRALGFEAVRAQSRAGSSGPWVTHFEAMALKTVVRRLFKWLPISVELATAIEADERAEIGIPQDNALIPTTVDSETGEIVSEAGEEPQASKPVDAGEWTPSPEEAEQIRLRELSEANG